MYEERAGSGYASNTPPPGPALYQWQLRTLCQVEDDELGGCRPGAGTCPQVEGRVIGRYYVDRYRLVQPDRSAVDGRTPVASVAVGAIYGTPYRTGPICVDVTDLAPGPTPDEIYRYLQTLPLPAGSTTIQPPGGQVLVGLPTIFYTDIPTEQTFTLDIRGYTVVITATAETFTWHTGDGTATVESTTPGAPYPNQTVTYDYTSGTYTSHLTTTWGATYTVDGGTPTAVPGTVTTDGPPVAFTAVQAHAVLTDPYD